MYSQLPSNTKRCPSKVVMWPSPYRLHVEEHFDFRTHFHLPFVQVLGVRKETILVFQRNATSTCFFLYTCTFIDKMFISLTCVHCDQVAVNIRIITQSSGLPRKLTYDKEQYLSHFCFNPQRFFLKEACNTGTLHNKNPEL